jgi:hypothetical protein
MAVMKDSGEFHDNGYSAVVLPIFLDWNNTAMVFKYVSALSQSRQKHTCMI